MSYRTFQDPEGRQWEVWLVLPLAAERRRVERRAESRAADSLYRGGEKRITPERRRNPFMRRTVVTSGFENGWLCFESVEEGEKRRLVPVPDGWAHASSEHLWQTVSSSDASHEMRSQLERDAEETRARLSSAYKAMEKDPLSCPDELLAATCAFVTHLKARGLPPEKMLATVKATLANISEAWISRDAKHFIGPQIAENVDREVILTAIKHYFGAEHRWKLTRRAWPSSQRKTVKSLGELQCCKLTTAIRNFS